MLWLGLHQLFTIWQEKWEANTSTCCTVMCSSDSPFIKLEEQVVKDV